MQWTVPQHYSDAFHPAGCKSSDYKPLKQRQVTNCFETIQCEWSIKGERSIECPLSRSCPVRWWRCVCLSARSFRPVALDWRLLAADTVWHEGALWLERKTAGDQVLTHKTAVPYPDHPEIRLWITIGARVCLALINYINLIFNCRLYLIDTSKTDLKFPTARIQHTKIAKQ